MKKFIIILILAVLVLAILGVKCTQGKNIGKFERDGISSINPTAFAVLKDGKVLLISDCENVLELDTPKKQVNSSEIYDPKKGKFTVINSTNTIHPFPSITLLKDGKVLLIGSGYLSQKHKQKFLNEGFKDSDYAEIFNPETTKFSFTGKMKHSRKNAATALLPNGKILVVGGEGLDSKLVKQAELYNPETEKFELTGYLNEPTRADINAILLHNGKVLIFGGNTKTTEIYNPSTGEFSYSANLNIDRPNYNNAIVLNDGKVLISGDSGNMKGHEYGSRSEIYDPNTNKFTLLPEMKIKRKNPKMSILKNGKILFAGGHKIVVGFGGSTGVQIKQSEIYDPENNEFTLDANMIYPEISRHSIPLKNGDILFVGGSIYDYKGKTQIYHLNR